MPLGLAGLALACGPKAERQAASAPSAVPPNVVLIVADALRADRLTAEAGGAPLMPALQAFAKECLDFRQAHAQATWTKPSMASIFTSLYPEVHNVLFGIHDTIYEGQPPEADVLPGDLETMARYLKEHGYATAAVQTNANITKDFGFDQGFDSYDFHKYPEYQGKDVTDASCAALESLKAPFFLYAHYMDTHAPYEPPPPYRDSLGKPPPLTTEDEQLLADYGASYIDRILYEVGLTKARKFGNLSRNGEQYVVQRYDEEARYLDAEAGRLLAYVRAHFPNTIIIFTADHGEELWDHGSIGHAKTVYEELARVPLLIYIPGVTGRTVDAPAESIDILPTCARLLGFEPRSTWQGVDLASDPSRQDVKRPVFVSTRMSIPGSRVDLASVIIGSGKLVVDRHANTKHYFNLASDPHEQSPQDTCPQEKSLVETLAAHEGAMKKHPLYRSAGSSTTVSPDTAEALRSIGYGS